MAESTKIQWASATWNPWHGCKKVSPGCKYCYMYRDKERRNPKYESKRKDYHDPTIVVRSKTGFEDPLKYDLPVRARIFTCSLSDFFIEEADQWRDEAWAIIKSLPQYDFLILTKRPENIRERLPKDWGEGYSNVWLGISVENQEMAEKRMPILSTIKCRVKFLSIEPLIGPVSLSRVETDVAGIGRFKVLSAFDWIIIGGESGNDTGKYRYRPCRLDWIKNIIADAIHNSIPVFVKQLGTHLAKRQGYKDRHGGNPDEWDEALRWLQFPRVKMTIEELEEEQEKQIPRECFICGDQCGSLVCDGCYDYYKSSQKSFQI